AVLNAIRYKLVCRVFACVNQDRRFEKVYVRKEVAGGPTWSQA
ncbi:MAG: hypothetical protein JWR05_631, partial [Mucilaginibacter sp.]|nr:hypothetical protein [Mucilaginibacter sp.]